MNLIQIAHKYQQAGFPVYPLAKGTKIPLKNSHGFKDATLDASKAEEWFKDESLNIGLNLSETNILVFDIDRGHASNTNGLKKLAALAKEQIAGELVDTYVEHTPSGGLHFFYRYPTTLKLTQRANLFSITDQEPTGLDYTAQGVPVWPTRTDKGQYQPANGKKLSDIADAPEWLITELSRVTSSPKSKFVKQAVTYKGWTGYLLDELVAGTTSGNRNNFMAKITGKLLTTGADPESCYNLLFYANENLEPPLSEKEVNAIFMSVIKRRINEQRNALNN